MLHAQKMDIQFLFVRPVMIRKKKKLLQRVIKTRKLEIIKNRLAKKKDIQEIRIVAFVISF